MDKNLKIPAKLDAILDEDYTLSGFVKSSVSDFSPWLGENNVKFFAEYTDHSLRHIEEVLKTADRLIREDCRGIITAGDVATLILAGFLHDSAMHLSVDGFATLIKSGNIVEGFRDKSWSSLWEDFIAESRRFSGRKLMSLFGDAEPIKPPPSNPDDLDAHKMTGKDLLLIGKFLRRHHHRLAHEIALFGVPGPDGFDLKLPEKEETKHIVDLAGVVARSHGLPLRSCFYYLESNYSSVIDFKEVHPVFLMALLRIIDILQLQSERAPRQVEKVRTLRSPVSRGEWEMHQAIEYINWTKFPETIFIHAEPPNARTFLRIKKQLNQIQAELDASWTVMSEAYDPVESLRNLGIKIRRVRSNLDDVESFAKKVDYIPCQAAFEVADSDLLKLLIGPLYGERPEIGIRELLQNSIDAVRELREYLDTHPEIQNPQLTEQEAEVVISIDEEEDGCWVTVSDQGIGMTVDTVRDYFLKAGASLRRSEIWRKTFEDEDGNSRVLRSGRFGIGVLAAFLLGDEVHVSTRHVGEPEDKGIEFSTGLNAETIELRKTKRPIGTTVRVRITDKVNVKRLWNWDWYCLSEPKVHRLINHRKKRLKQEYILPALNSELPPEWRRIFHPDYQDIHWTYSDVTDLVCNGIKVEDSIDYDEEKRGIWERKYYSIKSPKVSVFDFGAKLPLNLQRTGLTQTKYPFHEELIEDVLKDFIAFLFVYAPCLPFDSSSLLKWCDSSNYPGVESLNRKLYNVISPWICIKTGISFSPDLWLLNRVDAVSLLFAQYPSGTKYSSQIFTKSFPDFLHNFPKMALSSKLSVYLNDLIYAPFKIQADIIKDSISTGRLFSNGSIPDKEKRYHEAFFIPGKRALISRHVLAEIEKLSKFDKEELLPRKFMSEIVEEWKNENWVLWRRGDCPPPGFDFEKFAAENDGKNYDEWPCILPEWYFKDKKDRPEVEMSPLAKIWMEYVGSPVLPFDLEERRKLKGYTELKPYIDAHEKLKRSKS